MRSVPYAVVGAGGIGSAAAYRLSREAGAGVLCLEQWELGHRFGASEDHSRIIRLGYHAERYTALTRSAYAAWREVEDESGVPLVHTTGSVNVARAGTKGGEILDAYVTAMETPITSPRPTCGTSRPTASRFGSGTATATRSTTASPSSARWPRRRRRTSAARR